VPRPVAKPVLRIFMCPFIGGGVSYWGHWLQLLPSDVEAVIYLLPGRERRIGEPPLRSMTAVISELARASEACLELPFVMFGHSSGAHIAFQLTHELRDRHGVLPALLVLSSAEAPHPRRRPERLSHLPAPELIRRLSAVGGSPPAVLRSREAQRLIVPTLRADCEVAESVRHRPRPPLECDLLVLCGDDDARISVAQIEPWREQTVRRFTVATFPGGHFYFKGQEPDVVQRILAELGHRSS
jgi:medium-chain acyl-[acyl-carrier-protein] hydrolase